jgi:hypothetical protein
MRVAVVTPYFDEPDGWLAACLTSVEQQIPNATHILVSDGKPRAWLTKTNVQHIILPAGHSDYGNTPRAIGSLSAVAQGFEAIAYLDADNWYRNDHLTTLVGLHQRTGAEVVSSLRTLRRLDGSLLGYCRNSDGVRFSDTNCMMITRDALRLTPNWALMPLWAHPIGDRVIWRQIVEQGIPTANTGLHTVAYRSSFHGHYRAVGEEPPPELGAERFEVEEALDRWEAERHTALRFELEIEPASRSSRRELCVTATLVEE